MDNNLNTTFIISGGAGRVVTAVPALEKYYKLNPNDDFRVIVHGWDNLYWSHPILQRRTFNLAQKGLFDLIIKNSKICNPEPYQNHAFVNQKISLAEAFDQEINKTTDHSDLNPPCLYLSSIEDARIRDFIEFEKNKQKKRKTIVFQPYGSGVELFANQPIDPSNRSLKISAYLKMVQEFSKDAVIFYASPPQFRHPSDNISITFDHEQPYLRTMMSLIKNCDYFVGIDSVGQHIARAFNKPGTIIMGATNEINFSYPGHFQIIRKENHDPVYIPWRLSEFDCEFVNRENDGIMDFTDEDLDVIISTVQAKIVSSDVATVEAFAAEHIDFNVGKYD